MTCISNVYDCLSVCLLLFWFTNCNSMCAASCLIFKTIYVQPIWNPTTFSLWCWKLNLKPAERLWRLSKTGMASYRTPLVQWEFQDPQDPNMEVLYHIQIIFGISRSNIDLNNRPLLYGRSLQSIRSWNGHCIYIYKTIYVYVHIH